MQWQRDPMYASELSFLLWVDCSTHVGQFIVLYSETITGNLKNKGQRGGGRNNYQPSTSWTSKLLQMARIQYIHHHRLSFMCMCVVPGRRAWAGLYGRADLNAWSKNDEAQQHLPRASPVCHYLRPPRLLQEERGRVYSHQDSVQSL